MEQPEAVKEFPKKCRGLPESFSPEELDAVEQRCVDVDFSTARMLMPKDVFSEMMWPQLKAEIERHVEQTGDERGVPSMEDTYSNVFSLRGTIQVDRKILAGLGVTFEQLGDAMKTVMKLAVHKADTHWGGAMMTFLAQLTGQTIEQPKFETPFSELIRGDPRWCDQGRFESTFEFNGQPLRAFVLLWGGSQRCPFQDPDDPHYHGYSYGARDVIVTNLSNGEVLQYSTLLPHMAKHHHFLESSVCFYRVNPEQVVKVLGPFEEGKSYKLSSQRRMQLVKTSEINRLSLPEGLEEKTTRKVLLKDHVVYVLTENRIQVVPKTDQDDDGELDETYVAWLGLRDQSLRPGWSYSFEWKQVKSYNWSDWLPEANDGPHSKAAEDASGPKVMVLGANSTESKE